MTGAGSGSGANQTEVAVVGSINLDLTVEVERLPEPGETLLGHGLRRGGGGKGANQAVAAARLGRQVAFVGRIGDDSDGLELQQLIDREGIDVSALLPTPDTPTGLALIEVDDNGENRIVVVGGANRALTIDDLDRAQAQLAEASVILIQLEIPLDVVEHLAELARDWPGRLIVNPAPAARIELSHVDVLVPNRSELALLANASPPDSVDEVVDQARLLDPAPQAVVVTLGGDGAVVIEDLGADSPRVTPVPATKVTVVDTTGAGDAFCAGLADALCLGAELVDAAGWASAVAAAAVTRPGTWSAFPHRSELIR